MMRMKLSRSDWVEVGTRMGWMKTAKKYDSLDDCLKDCPDTDPDARQECKDDCARMFTKADSGKGPEVGKQGDKLVRFLCPGKECNSVLAVPSSARGKLVRCRRCGTHIRIPMPRAEGPSEGSST